VFTILRNGASDWLAPLHITDQRSYETLMDASKEAYLPSPVLKYSGDSTIWKELQYITETVNDFIIRMHKVAKRLGR
jgi:hypothetical protein